MTSTKVEFTEEEVLKFDDEKRNIKWITVSTTKIGKRLKRNLEDELQ